MPSANTLILNRAKILSSDKGIISKMSIRHLIIASNAASLLVMKMVFLNTVEAPCSQSYSNLKWPIYMID